MRVCVCVWVLLKAEKTSNPKVMVATKNALNQATLIAKHTALVPTVRDSVWADLRLGQADLRLGLADLRLGLADLRLGLADLRLGLADLRLGQADLRLGLADLRLGLALAGDAPSSEEWSSVPRGSSPGGRGIFTRGSCRGEGNIHQGFIQEGNIHQGFIQEGNNRQGFIQGGEGTTHTPWHSI